MRPMLVPVVAAALIAIVVLVAVVLKTSRTRGEDAVARMNDAEREFLSNLETISATSTLESVTAILGPPDRPCAGVRPSWIAPGGSARSQVAVYFIGEGPFKVRWMKIGEFTWERNFPENLPGATK